jgi:hypothetical protein
VKADANKLQGRSNCLFQVRRGQLRGIGQKFISSGSNSCTATRLDGKGYLRYVAFLPHFVPNPE